MSRRKRRRYKRIYRDARLDPNAKDTHHIFYMGKAFSKGALSELRNFFYCRVEIPRNTLHKKIHSAVRTVHPCKSTNAQEVLAQLRTLLRYGAIGENDRIEKRLMVLIALLEYVEPETTDALKKQLDVVREFYLGSPW